MAWAIESMVKVPLKIGISSVLIGRILWGIYLESHGFGDGFAVMMCMRHREVMSPLTDVTTRVCMKYQRLTTCAASDN